MSSPSPPNSTSSSSSPPPSSTDKSSPSSTPSPSAPLVSLRSLSVVSMWSWDIESETCAICRNLIMEMCIECQANSNSSTSHQNTNDNSPSSSLSSECIVAWGVCNHAFHSHCIARWLKTRSVCPLDNQDWEYLRYGK